jgi:ATP-dependent protease Clp ATPase subunit
MMRHCSFCGKSSEDKSVWEIVVQGDVGICDNCIVLCAAVIAEHRHKKINMLEATIHNLKSEKRHNGNT